MLVEEEMRMRIRRHERFRATVPEWNKAENNLFRVF
jgi:hypothetical protein